MSDVDNESGIAYGYMMLMLYAGTAIVIWFCWSFIFNNIIVDAINPMITTGDLSLQTTSAVGWQVNVLRYSPPIILLFIFIMGINRAIFKKGMGG